MLTIQSATTPVYANAEGTAIDLQVKFAEFEQVLSFTATSYDTMPYGVELYNRALAGEFGAVAAYVPVPIPTQPQPTTVGAQTL
jgi:hypothetical protein